MKRFSLLTYRVECDYRPGRFIIVQAESVYDALVAGAKEFGVDIDQLSASIQ
jgi:hypothetical protein